MPPSVLLSCILFALFERFLRPRASSGVDLCHSAFAVNRESNSISEAKFTSNRGPLPSLAMELVPLRREFVAVAVELSLFSTKALTIGIVNSCPGLDIPIIQ